EPMRRRELLSQAGAAAVAYPFAARAQQQPLPVIGFLHSGSPGPFANLVAAFREGLREASYVEGQNILVDFRWAEGQYDLVPELLNTSNPTAATQLTEFQEAARGIGQPIHIVKATSERELDAAFASLPELRPDALLVSPDPFFYSRRNQIVRLAGRLALPALYEQREFTLAGGLMSYGTSLAHGYRQAGIYAGQ